VCEHHSGRFVARHVVDGRYCSLGSFGTAVEAAAAYARSVGEPPERRTSGAAGQLPVPPLLPGPVLLPVPPLLSLPSSAAAPSSATHAVASSSAHAAASSADAAASSAALAPCSEVAPPPVPAGGKGRPPPGSACAICHEKKLRCVRLPGGSCEYCVSNGLTCVRRGSSGGNCSVTAPCCSAYRGNPLKLDLIEGDATLQALLVRTAGETGARTRDLLCAEGYHVTRKNVLNYRRTRKCARDAQAQREPERVSQP